MNWLTSFWQALRRPRAQPHAATPIRTRDIAGWAGEPFNFTPLSEEAMDSACCEAERLHHNFIGTEHLLLGLVRSGRGTAVQVLLKMGLNLQTIRTEVEKHLLRPSEAVSAETPYTPRVKKVLRFAANEARALGHTHIGTEHLLLGLLAEHDGIAARVLMNLGFDINATRQQVLRELDRNQSPPSKKPRPPTKT